MVSTKPFDFAHRSRWVSASDAAHDVDETPERLADLLERRGREWDGWAVIPANDEALAALALHHKRLSSKFRVLAPEHELARYFLDKELMNELAATTGVQQPRCFGPALEETASSPDLVYPVVVKPSVSYLFTPRFDLL